MRMINRINNLDFNPKSDLRRRVLGRHAVECKVLEVYAICCLRAGRWDCVERLHKRFNHHSCLLQRVVPASPSKPHNALAGCDVLRIMKIKSVQASSARLPPPAALDGVRERQIKIHYHLLNDLLVAFINSNKP
jgi:hypothetical protein